MDLTGHASMVAGPLANLRFWRRAVRRLQGEIRDRRPAVFVPVDSPALNWHLCKVSKQVGTRVLHFIAPQVWAWARWRIKKVRRLSDHVCCLLPFEEGYFRDRGVEATFIGHPIFDDLPPARAPEACPDLLEAWTSGAWKVALLPGSRPGEIRGHTAALAAVGEAIRRRWPAARCTMTARDELARERIEASLQNGKRHVASPGLPASAGSNSVPDGIALRVGETADVLAESHFAIAASGTVTLESRGLRRAHGDPPPPARL